MCALCGVTHTLITMLDQCLPRPHHSPFTIHTHRLSHYEYTHKEMYTYQKQNIYVEISFMIFSDVSSEHFKQTGLFSPQMNRLQAHRFSGSDRNALSNCILSPCNTIHLISDMNQPVKQEPDQILVTHQSTFRPKDFLTCTF